MLKPLSPDVVSACVIAADVCTSYSRAGRGEPVLLLVEDAALRAALLDHFPRHLLVIAPEPVPVRVGVASASADFADWLGSFLDALGHERVAIVADLALAAAARRFARDEPDRVTGLEITDGAGERGGEALAGH